MFMYTYTCYAESEVNKQPATEQFISAFLYAFYHENYLCHFIFFRASYNLGSKSSLK